MVSTDGGLGQLPMTPTRDPSAATERLCSLGDAHTEFSERVRLSEAPTPPRDKVRGTWGRFAKKSYPSPKTPRGSLEPAMNCMALVPSGTKLLSTHDHDETALRLKRIPTPLRNFQAADCTSTETHLFESARDGKRRCDGSIVSPSDQHHERVRRRIRGKMPDPSLPRPSCCTAASTSVKTIFKEIQKASAGCTPRSSARLVPRCGKRGGRSSGRPALSKHKKHGQQHGHMTESCQNGSDVTLVPVRRRFTSKVRPPPGQVLRSQPCHDLDVTFSTVSRRTKRRINSKDSLAAFTSEEGASSLEPATQPTLALETSGNDSEAVSSIGEEGSDDVVVPFQSADSPSPVSIVEAWRARARSCATSPQCSSDSRLRIVMSSSRSAPSLDPVGRLPWDHAQDESLQLALRDVRPSTPRFWDIVGARVGRTPQDCQSKAFPAVGLSSQRHPSGTGASIECVALVPLEKPPSTGKQLSNDTTELSRRSDRPVRPFLGPPASNIGFVALYNFRCGSLVLPRGKVSVACPVPLTDVAEPI
eukprot:TRINITY_DN50137_c0_g1_i1.p1 TRINITY_DN50137_c0_g1~~TRINITY_DN50137_c0_g1_i1.p1  ORF type:complete len:556 (+),score=43.73 TRINITY_DN50137_c0_g1_i1:74-1669(+)